MMTDLLLIHLQQTYEGRKKVLHKKTNLYLLPICKAEEPDNDKSAQQPNINSTVPAVQVKEFYALEADKSKKFFFSLSLDFVQLAKLIDLITSSSDVRYLKVAIWPGIGFSNNNKNYQSFL